MLPVSDNLTAARISTMNLQASAHNLANVNTEGFQAQQITQSTGPGGEGLQAHVSPTQAPAPVILRDGQLRVQSNTDMTREAVTHMSAAAAFKSNMGVMQVQDSLTEAILDVVA
jgi:flagellar basal body rod protein FlgG